MLIKSLGVYPRKLDLDVFEQETKARVYILKQENPELYDDVTLDEDIPVYTFQDLLNVGEIIYTDDAIADRTM